MEADKLNSSTLNNQHNLDNLDDRTLADAQRLLAMTIARHRDVVAGEARATRGGVHVDLFSPACRRTVRLGFTWRGMRVDTFAGDQGVCTRRLLPAEVSAETVTDELRRAVGWVNCALADACAPVWSPDVCAALRVVACTLLAQVTGVHVDRPARVKPRRRWITRVLPKKRAHSASNFC